MFIYKICRSSFSVSQRSAKAMGMVAIDTNMAALSTIMANSMVTANMVTAREV